MCKISAPVAVKTVPPLSWEELNKRSFDFDIFTPDCLMPNSLNYDAKMDDSKAFGGDLFFSPTESESLFPSEYDMSMFGLFPQQESLEVVPSLQKDQVLFNATLPSLEESVGVETLKANSTGHNDTNSDSTCSVTSGSPRSSSKSFDPTSRLQKRKIGNTNAKKSEDGISDELRRKRQKQREAAKRCRDKRMSALQIAEERANQAEAEKLELLVQVRVLEEAKKEWMAKEQKMQQEIFNLSRKVQF